MTDTDSVQALPFMIIPSTSLQLIAFTFACSIFLSEAGKLMAARPEALSQYESLAALQAALPTSFTSKRRLNTSQHKSAALAKSQKVHAKAMVNAMAAAATPPMQPPVPGAAPAVSPMTNPHAFGNGIAQAYMHQQQGQQ